MRIRKYKHLEPRPKSFYRQLFVKGTRIRAVVIYNLAGTEEPMSPEEIAADMGLPLEAVLEAIAYCESKPPEVAEDFAREEALIQARAAEAKNDAKPSRRRPQARKEMAPRS